MKANIFLILLFSFTAHAQTTAFTFQGRLNDAGVAQPVNGTYDFQFTLFDAASTQIGATQSRAGTVVTNGVFNVQLDFGINPFIAGADRFLQIAVKRSIDPTFTTLTPRQQLTSVPYAVQTLNASNLAGLSVSQFVQVNDSRLTDARDPLPFSANYIQNGTTPQAAANFDVTELPASAPKNELLEPIVLVSPEFNPKKALLVPEVFAFPELLPKKELPVAVVAAPA